jgi:hypothetical protein
MCIARTKAGFPNELKLNYVDCEACVYTHLTIYILVFQFNSIGTSAGNNLVEHY